MTSAGLALKISNNDNPKALKASETQPLNLSLDKVTMWGTEVPIRYERIVGRTAPGYKYDQKENVLVITNLNRTNSHDKNLIREYILRTLSSYGDPGDDNGNPGDWWKAYWKAREI